MKKCIDIEIIFDRLLEVCWKYLGHYNRAEFTICLYDVPKNEISSIKTSTKNVVGITKVNFIVCSPNSETTNIVIKDINL